MLCFLYWAGHCNPSYLHPVLVYLSKSSHLKFNGLYPSAGFIPVCSLGVCQVARMNFGKDVSTLKYFTICGLQEGFEPFAVNMNRDVTMWLSKRLPQFVPVPPNHQHIEVHTLHTRLSLHVVHIHSFKTVTTLCFL